MAAPAGRETAPGSFPRPSSGTSGPTDLAAVGCARSGGGADAAAALKAPDRSSEPIALMGAASVNRAASMSPRGAMVTPLGCGGSVGRSPAAMAGCASVAPGEPPLGAKTAMTSAAPNKAAPAVASAEAISIRRSERRSGAEPSFRASREESTPKPEKRQTLGAGAAPVRSPAPHAIIGSSGAPSGARIAAASNRLVSNAVGSSNDRRSGASLRATSRSAGSSALAGRARPGRRPRSYSSKLISAPPKYSETSIPHSQPQRRASYACRSEPWDDRSAAKPATLSAPWSNQGGHGRFVTGL